MNADPNARDQMLNDLASSLTPALDPISDTPPAPPVIPDHELTRRIGRGSYGEVWLARNALGTWRAVKIVHRAAFDHDRPYEREFEGIRRFEPISRTHPSQLNVLHVGRNDADGHFYYVMELADDATPVVQPAKQNEPAALDSPTGKSALRGAGFPDGTLPTAKSELHPDTYSPRTLRSDLYHRGRLPFEACLDIGLALATALDHLHRNGLVHRDIKPSNIIFVNGIPKLADIGLVAQAEATLSLVGTEGYLPPEGPGTPQADIYSLGKVLYEMATGRDRQEFPELPTNLVQQPAVERAQLGELNEIIVRACHADLNQRYKTAAEFHADLALLQSGKSVSRMRAAERRLRFVQRAGAVVTVLAAVIAAGWIWQARQTHIVQDLVTEKTKLADEKTRLAEENRQIAEEKTRLAAEKSALAEENRNRLVRLDIANGVRLLDEEDPAGALLWFADALPLVSNKAGEESIHRIRIQQTLNASPSLRQVVAEEARVSAGAFSPDGRRFATLTFVNAGSLGMREAESGRELWRLAHDQCALQEVRFSQDGNRVLVSSIPPRGRWIHDIETDLKTAEVVDAETGRLLFQRTHSDLTSTAFSPDDRWLAIAHTNLTIELLDIRDGHPVAELRGHTGEITSLEFSSDSGLLVSASRDQSVRFWRVPSGDSVGEAIVLDHLVSRVAWSRDGRYLASGWDQVVRPGTASQPSTVQVWDVDSRQKLASGDITVPQGSCLFFFSPGSNPRLFTGSEAGHVRVWNLGTNLTQEADLDLGAGAALRWAFSPDARMLALGTAAGLVSIWSTETWQLLFPFLHHNGWVLSLDFSPDGGQLLTTGDDGTTKRWSLRLEKEAAQFALSTNLAAIIGGPVGRTPGLIPVELADGWLHLVDPDRLKDVQTLRPRQPGVAMAGWVAGSTGRYWVLGEPGGIEGAPDHLTLWTQQNGVFRFSVLTLPDMGGYCQFSGDDSRLSTFGRDSTVRVWRTADGTLERSIPVSRSFRNVSWQVLAEPFSPDGRTFLLASGGTPNPLLLQLFDLATGQITGKPVHVPAFYAVTKMRFSPDHTQFAFVNAYQTASILDFSTGTIKMTTPKHGGTLLNLDWSPDGKKFLTAGDAPDVKLWDAGTGAMLLSPMEIDKTPVGQACWSADGRFITARSDAKGFRVWDSSTAEAVTPVLHHQGSVVQFCITPNHRLITASLPNLLRAWDLKPTPLPADVIADYAKLLSGRRLNAGGVLLPIPAKELAELAQSPRARAPQMFE